MKNWFKANSAHLIVIAIFIALVFFYFTPVWQGKTLAQSDVVQAQAAQKELFDFKAKDGKAPLWTNSMFGGLSEPNGYGAILFVGGLFPF